MNHINTKMSLVALCLLITGSACAQPLKENEFRIKGTLEGLNENHLVFLRYEDKGTNVVDTIPHTNGNFDWVRTVAGTSPIYATIMIRDLTFKPRGSSMIMFKKGGLTFFISPQASITIKGDVINYNIATVSGGLLNDDLAALDAKLYNTQLKINELQDLFNEASWNEDKATEDALRIKREEYSKEETAIREKFIADNPNSLYAAFLFLQRIRGSSKSAQELEDDFAKFGDKARNSDYGQEIAEYIAGAKAATVGSIASNFTQIDSEGKTFSLSDYRGKYVLLDFWGSWCAPCRESNPHLIELYNKYKDQNFELLGMAGNESGRDKWLAAIKADGLVWRQVNLKENDERQTIVRLFNVKGYPTKILIDPQGRIIAHALGGSMDVDTKLKEVFGK